tara:strand:- start:72 stop:530 length:459 start_codon:yes stop_codon:yes gene_type:complete
MSSKKAMLMNAIGGIADDLIQQGSTADKGDLVQKIYGTICGIDWGDDPYAGIEEEGRILEEWLSILQHKNNTRAVCDEIERIKGDPSLGLEQPQPPSFFMGCGCYHSYNHGVDSYTDYATEREFTGLWGDKGKFVQREGSVYSWNFKHTPWM